eukprot:29833-Pelagococcus_subviridis.AAC.8
MPSGGRSTAARVGSIERLGSSFASPRDLLSASGRLRSRDLAPRDVSGVREERASGSPGDAACARCQLRAVRRSRGGAGGMATERARDPFNSAAVRTTSALRVARRAGEELRRADRGSRGAYCRRIPAAPVVTPSSAPVDVRDGHPRRGLRQRQRRRERRRRRRRRRRRDRPRARGGDDRAGAGRRRRGRRGKGTRRRARGDVDEARARAGDAAGGVQVRRLRRRVVRQSRELLLDLPGRDAASAEAGGDVRALSSPASERVHYSFVRSSFPLAFPRSRRLNASISSPRVLPSQRAGDQRRRRQRRRRRPRERRQTRQGGGHRVGVDGVPAAQDLDPPRRRRQSHRDENGRAAANHRGEDEDGERPQGDHVDADDHGDARRGEVGQGGRDRDAGCERRALDEGRVDWEVRIQGTASLQRHVRQRREAARRAGV